MIARFSVSVFLAACVMWPTVVSAQIGSDPEGVVTIGDGIPTPIVPQFTSRWQSLSSGPQPDAKSEVEQIVRAQSPGGPVQYAGAYAPQSGVDSYGDGSGFQAPVYQAQPLPWERGGNSAFRKFITEVLPNNYFRVEYLSWFIDDIGSQAVGSDTTLTEDVRDPMTLQSNAFFVQAGTLPDPMDSQTLLVPTTESIGFDRLSGLRVTYGIPLTFGRVEFSGFALEHADSQILNPGFGPRRGERALATATATGQRAQFVLAQELIVPEPGYNTFAPGIVQANGQVPQPGLTGIDLNIPIFSEIPQIPPARLIGPGANNFLYLRSSSVADVRSTPFNFFRVGIDPPTNGTPISPLMALANVQELIPRQGTNINEGPDPLTPGGDTIIRITGAGTTASIFDTINTARTITGGSTTLLPDVLSPGGITLPAGTLLRTNETGIPVMPLLSNGQVGTDFLIFNGGYGADYDSNVWGTDAKLILDIGPNHNGMKLNPLVGFRYMSVDERFRQVGVSTVGLLRLDRVGAAEAVFEAPRAAIIDSEVQNNLYGLQVGASAEYNNEYFSLGVEPKVSMGVNQYKASVTTRQLRSINDPEVTTRDDSFTFAPVFDVNLYGQVHVTPYFTLHAGYNFTYLFQVTRPAENIVYNDNGPTALPGVVVDAETQDMHIQGLTIGGEFRFRDLKFR